MMDFFAEFIVFFAVLDEFRQLAFENFGLLTQRQNLSLADRNRAPTVRMRQLNFRARSVRSLQKKSDCRANNLRLDQRSLA